MQFKICCVCGLSFPISVMQPIYVRKDGKIIKVGICDYCKDKKIKEAQENKNENH